MDKEEEIEQERRSLTKGSKMNHVGIDSFLLVNTDFSLFCPSILLLVGNFASVPIHLIFKDLVVVLIQNQLLHRLVLSWICQFLHF